MNTQKKSKYLNGINNKYEYIITIIYFEENNIEYITFLENLKLKCDKLIVGIYNNIDDILTVKETIRKYAYDIFDIYDNNLSLNIQNYIQNNNIKNIFNIDYSKNTQYINNILNNISYNNFMLYTTNFTNIYCDNHSNSLRNNHFWVYPKNKKLVNNNWDTYDVNICKNNIFILNRKDNLKEYKCLCKNNCIDLLVDKHSKYYYKDDDFEIYNNNGKMIIKYNNNVKEQTFDIINYNHDSDGTDNYRYIKYNNMLYLILYGIPNDNNIKQNYIYDVYNDKINKLFIKNNNISNIIQNNWTPYIFNNEFYFIYSFFDLCVLKITDINIGECEIIYGDINNFKNDINNVYGGTNLIYWKNDLLIGFGYTIEPYYPIPIIFDPINYKLIYGNKFIINPPFKLIKPMEHVFQIPYYFEEKNDIFYLLVYSDKQSSIYYKYSNNNINIIFNSLLKSNICYIHTNNDINISDKNNLLKIMDIEYNNYTNFKELINNKISINNINNNIKHAILNNDPIEEYLHVVVVISNPCSFARRYILAKEFLKRLEHEKNIKVYVVELVYENQDFFITNNENPQHLQIRTNKNPLWHKENMINLGVKYLLPENWKAMAWIDADIEFESPTWALDTLKLLNGSYDIVQLFSHCIFMDKNGNPLNIFTSFCFQYCRQNNNNNKNTDLSFWHPGFAWAINRERYDKIGGIFDKAILGNGDFIMAKCFIGKTNIFLKDMFSKENMNHVISFESKCVGTKLGYVPNVIRHHFHGTRKNRQHIKKWELLLENNFNIDKHIKYNEFGLIIPSDKFPSKLLIEIMNVFIVRNDDEELN